MKINVWYKLNYPITKNALDKGPTSVDGREIWIVKPAQFNIYTHASLSPEFFGLILT